MDTSVPVAVRNKDVAVRADGGFGWPVERRSHARDATCDLTVVASVGGNTRRAQRHQERGIRRELANGVVTVVNGVDEIIAVDRQRMDALGEHVFTERAHESSVRLVDDAAGISPGQHEHAILGIDSDSDYVAVPVSRGKALPL